MNILKITILFALAGSVAIFAADGQVTLVSLEAAREQGRVKSRFLKETKAPVKTNDAIPKADVAYFQKSVMPILKKSCMNCHGPKKSEGRLRIDTLNPDLLTGPDVERWREIYNAVSNSEMPPADEPGYALANNDRASMVDWLSDELNKASLIRRNTKDHSSFRRLTKYEYDYALQDLLGLPYSLANKLPPESVTEDGFKNSSELLQISAMQFETYREIALKALKRATVSGDRRPEAVTYQISMRQELEKATAKKDSKEAVKGKKNAKTSKNQQQLLDQQTGESIPFPAVKFAPKPNAVAGQTPDVSPVVLLLPSSNELKLDLDRFLPDEGNMRVRVRVGRSTMNPEEFASLRLMLSAHTSNDANFSQVISQRDIPVTASAENPEFINFDVQLSDIQRNPFRKLTTTFPRRDEFLHIQNISNAFKGGDERLHLVIDYIEISAPYFEQWPPKTHTNVFIESANKGDEQVYGREVLTRFLRNVWRRPATSREVDQFMALFTKYRPGFSTFEDAMVEVLATALATPEFLYLTQRVSNDKSKSATISELELASRLAVFLWSSIPDDELLKLAEQGRLRQPDVLSGQVKRMLADPRSRRFSQNFVEQWLGLDGLNSVTHIPPQLRDSIQEEPIAFFDEVLRQNRSIMDFIHSDYAVVNEKLAAHYGIPKVYGPHFRKVPITAQSNRGGILTDAAMLAMNSDGKDSNPLKRGVWMLKRILHDPPPPPPPNVPEVDLTNPEILKMTLKERIVDHRNKAACISCHAKIDPWGIAFENYDALGIFRTSIKNKPVDATSELFNHQTLAGIDGVKRYLLLERQDQFARAMVHKLTAYALGRPLSFGDRADIDNLTAQLRRHDDKLGELIPLIINSNIFNSN
jgi:mono/diheme cytochrome c family protein